MQEGSRKAPCAHQAQRLDCGKEGEEEKAGKVSFVVIQFVQFVKLIHCREVKPDSKYTGRKRKTKF